MCKKDFISYKNGLLCQKCYSSKAIAYYHRTKKVVICECGKSVIQHYIKIHRKSNLHKRWLESNVEYILSN